VGHSSADFASCSALAAVLLARKPVAICSDNAGEFRRSVHARQALRRPRKQKRPATPRRVQRKTVLELKLWLRYDRNTNHSWTVKEKLFRLEIRHQAGTSAKKNNSARTRKAEQILGDLVRG